MYKHSSTKKPESECKGDGYAEERHAAFFPRRFIAQKSAAGFSIIEMIVTISVFVFLSATLLLSYSGMNKHFNVDSQAHQIGQWVRDAQVSAMSVRSAQTQTGTYSGYGIHFATATPGRFIYFADLNGNRAYDAGVCGATNSECEREIILTQGGTIYSLCGQVTGAVFTANCLSPNGASDVFDIVFTRPDPDARITGDKNGAAFPTSYSSARITITSLQGYRRTVEVWGTGQISVQ